MGLERTLLERLDHAQTEADQKSLLETLENNLKELLTTCQEEIKDLPKGYGLLPLNDVFSNSAEPIDEIRKAIREKLKNHESKLAEIQVNVLSVDRSPMFEIKAKLASSRFPLLDTLIFKVSWDKEGHTVLKPSYSYKEKARREMIHNSIKKNLKNLFNTRQGSVMILPESYGLPDFNDIAQFSDPTTAICQAVQDNITQYEPRLTEPIEVEQIPDDNQPLDLQFKITAQLVVGKNKPTSTISFTTATTESGHFSLEE